MTTTAAETTTARQPSSKRAAMISARNAKHQDAADRAADGFVRTPADVAERMMTVHPEMGSFRRGARVLEPSAGDGALVREILEYDRDVHVDAVEPNDRRADALQALADSEEFAGRLTVHRMTFERFAVLYGTLPQHEFDAVVMNPPFGDSSRDLVWMDHIMQAWRMLRPGAQLVAVVPNGYQYRADKAHRAMREWAAERGGRYEQLERDAFQASGCGVNAGLLTVVKPLPSRPDGSPLWLAAPAVSEPVDVGRYPLVTASAALAAPVQVFADGYLGGDDQTLCFVGTCFACHRPLWWKNANGAYGAMPYHGHTVAADESGKTGPSVVLCLDHYTHSDIQAAAVTAAQPYWRAGTGVPVGPRILPGDLAEGMWAEVTSLDPHGGQFTIAGQLLADPVAGDSGRVMVLMRTNHGAVVELSAACDAPVNLISGGAPAGGQVDGRHARKAGVPTGTPTPAHARRSAVAGTTAPDGAAQLPAVAVAGPPVPSPAGGKVNAQLDIWGPLIEASRP